MRVDPFFQIKQTYALDNLTGQQNLLSGQLSSGLAVALPSDNPTAAAQSVALGSGIARDDAYLQAATGVQSQLQVAGSALGSVVTQITSAISLAVSGLDGTLNSSELQTIGQQMSGLRDEVVSLANTSYAGNYLFAGTSSAKPYTNDTTTTPATAVYSGDANSQYAQTPGGQKVITGLSGSAIFSASGADVLTSLNKLVADFSSGTVSSTSAADLAQLQAGLTNVSTQRGVLDSSLSTLEQTTTYTQTDATNLKASQSQLVASDTATIASQLSMNETQQQALIATISSAGKNNLFNDIQP
jgi:flagellar hook-associated protein 3 FlgL